jgi:pimeloyl-ACP methyl ester carboxylesterase
MASVKASDGCLLYAEAHGDGVPVLLSCGLCTTHENWRPQVAPFVAAGLRVILWDYRGHGRSQAPRDPAAYSMQQVVDDLGRVLAWGAGGRPAIVGGLSFGGLASLHFALAAPARVLALLLIDTGPGFKNPEAQARWAAQVERTAGFLEARGCQAFIESKAAATAIGLRPELPAAQAAARAIAAQDPVGLALFARRIAAVAPPVIDQLASIELPALVVVGEKDEPYLRASELLASRLPKAEAVRIAGAGHVVNLEEPKAFDAAVLGYLGRVITPPPA